VVGSDHGYASEAETFDEFFGRRDGEHVELYRLGGDAAARTRSSP
jgi:hypothetical protein